MLLSALAITGLATSLAALPTLSTPWTAKVSKTLPHPEYPRPTMVRKDWLNLNGPWDYAVGKNQPAKYDGKILVPFPIESALSGVQKPVGPDETLFYRRTVRIPENWPVGPVLLHFGGIDHKARVLVNGHLAVSHEGGYDPFSVDIRPFLKGDNQEIVVEVRDGTDSAGQARGKQVLKPEGIWYTPSSGIWQTVWIEPVPVDHIQSYHAVPDLERGGIVLTVSGSEGSKVEAEVTLGGKVVSKAGFFANEPYFLPVPDAKLWSPETPTLYDLKLTLLGSRSEDTVTSYFGMRQMHLGKDKSGVTRLFLNGKPYFQFGPLDQGFWPDGIYTAPTDDALKFDIQAAKKMGCNMLRKHVKVEPERFYTWCDKLGILVWQDMPSGEFEKAGGKTGYEREWPRIIQARWNHPSIVMWVPFNEGWGQYDTARITDLTRQTDPSRLVDNPSGWTDVGAGDVHDIHSYPGPSTPAWEPKRAAVLGEFGGLGLPIDGHTWINKNNWGYVTYKSPAELTTAYVGLLNKLKDLIPMGLSAAVYTQTTDVEVEVNGWLTYDRKVWKIDPKQVQKATKALYKAPSAIEVVVPTRQAWQFTTVKPSTHWFEEQFDDSKWTTGTASFGTKETPNAEVGTLWTTPDIWIRRSFTLRQGIKPADLRLWIYHDEDAEVYINGVLAASPRGYTSSFALIGLSAQAAKALRRGPNTIAIHCHQTSGGQNVDCGLVQILPN